MMIVFDDNEFEIALVTYQRPQYVKNWLIHCYKPIVDRNIKLTVYDSSVDDKTCKIIRDFNSILNKKIEYHRVDNNTIIGYKPMLPIMDTASEYLWVCGDSRYHDFRELDIKVFPYLKNKDIDYCVINIGNNNLTKDSIFEDDSKMIHSVFVPSTCIGMSIYRNSIFKPIKEDTTLLDKYDKLFKNNYGFAWLGYFYNLYASNNYKTLLVNLKIFTIMQRTKIQSWAKRFYGCWVFDLFQIIDNISDSYYKKNDIPKETWSIMNLNSIEYGYRARKYGDLNGDCYEKLKKRGFIRKITDKPERIRFFAISPMILVESVYILYKAFDVLIRFYNIIKKVIWRDRY